MRWISAGLIAVMSLIMVSMMLAICLLTVRSLIGPFYVRSVSLRMANGVIEVSHTDPVAMTSEPDGSSPRTYISVHMHWIAPKHEWLWPVFWHSKTSSILVATSVNASGGTVKLSGWVLWISVWMLMIAPAAVSGLAFRRWLQNLRTLRRGFAVDSTMGP